MTDRRRVVAIDQRPGTLSNDGLHTPAKSNRPVSWHPSSHIGQQPNFHPSYAMAYLNTPNDIHIFDLPPTPAAYSGYTSPSSTFSPLSAPFTGYGEQHSYMESTPYPSNGHYPHPEQVGGQQVPNYISAPSDNTDSTLYSHFDWSSFAQDGFERSTAPPTPENFLPIQHPDPTFPSDEAIPYHALSDSTPEDDGEILCGMGLYDSPDIGKTFTSDPQLDSYRSSMMSQMLGPTYRKESTGKGLKLEETWNPPPSDDENEEDDAEQDGEGEDDDDAIAQMENHEVNKPLKITLQDVSLPNPAPLDSIVQNNDRINWL